VSSSVKQNAQPSKFRTSAFPFLAASLAWS
jgi:hypothetical protein